MKKEMKMEALNLDWVRRFSGKLSEVCGLLNMIVACADTTLKLAGFYRKLTDDPGVRVDTHVVWELKAKVAVDDPKSVNEPTVHQLNVGGWTTAPIMLQMLLPLMTSHFEHLKLVEDESTELQEVLKAVSPFRDRIFAVDEQGNLTLQDETKPKPN